MLDQGRNSLDVRLLRGTLLLLMRILFRIEHHGVENVPPRGPLVIVANHVTYFDPFWIAVRIYRAVRFMAWDKIFNLPIAGSIFRWFGAFPVSLENPESSAYRSALGVLREGAALMIFPEGGRSGDGYLLPFKPGAARLALRTGATILPVVVHGGERVWNRHMWLPRPAKVRVEYLKPVTADQFASTALELSRQIRALIASRLGHPIHK
jgi:1-acyl-sn-glycerol-3-phosphate acyltransferase